ncbi:hypothetical protein MTO96_045161, partial [Rhipicephalus appendiculatus]
MKMERSRTHYQTCKQKKSTTEKWRRRYQGAWHCWEWDNSRSSLMVFIRLPQLRAAQFFFRHGILAPIDDVYKNLMLLLKRNSKTHGHHKDFVVVVTRRPLVTKWGFALRGGMCTGQNVAVVKDDGAFEMVNHLLKSMLHAFGVDLDGEGFARKCPNSGGFLMGKENFHIPLSFSYCTKAQVGAVL